jgi:hypothetical protein
MDNKSVPPDHASARQTEMGEQFNRVLFAAVDALQENQISYALIGGIAASGMGRPRPTHDIDVFVRPEDADAALDALSRNGFSTEKTDRRWLYKGWLDGMMVDVIFRSTGDIYFDDEMAHRARPIQYHGRAIPAVSPEDLIIIKAAVHNEAGPHHWHDALAILSHAHVDWQYLLKRARRAPRRLLALLVYAQSNDIWIPNYVIFDLVHGIFGEVSTEGPSPVKGELARSAERPPSSPVHEHGPRSPPSGEAGTMTEPQPTWRAPDQAQSLAQDTAVSDAYLVARAHDRLAQEASTAALDLQISLGYKRILIKGEVQNSAQRSAIDRVIAEIANGFKIDNQVRITEVGPCLGEEVV